VRALAERDGLLGGAGLGGGDALEEVRARYRCGRRRGRRMLRPGAGTACAGHRHAAAAPWPAESRARLPPPHCLDPRSQTHNPPPLTRQPPPPARAGALEEELVEVELPGGGGKGGGGSGSDGFVIQVRDP
jgi:hypothetical protein